MFSIKNYIILFAILIILGILHSRFEEKRLREENTNDYESIQKYLLSDGTNLVNAKKPIMWIHVPYEYNSRNWLSFGSRSSLELNQPYLYLTIKSIIQKCDQSFHICLIDDRTFGKLIPGWNIQMDHISSPITDKIRKLGLAKLIYMYGGMVVPLSFLCMKDLISMYEISTASDHMFICENNDKNVSSTKFQYYPDLNFMGAKKETEIVRQRYRERK